ncbi:hypothetical protein ACPDHJ_05935 [Myroides sp. C8-3]|uniref:hypothetical protein n=1 Tax=Myroides sp. C8-3 TaxID=3400533 RepID=UPI003D2F7E3C
MSRNRLFSLERDTDVPFSSSTPKWISKYIVKNLLNIQSIEEDITRLPTPGEHFYLNSERNFSLYLFVIMISKREIIKQLTWFTNLLTIAEYNALVELQEKCSIGEIIVMVNTKPVFINSKANFEVKVATLSAELLLCLTTNNHYVFESSSMIRDIETFYFLSIANDKELLEFRASVISHPRLKKDDT